MLINFLSKRIRGNYLNQDKLNVLSFFSNNTLSIRRSMIADVGRYDEQFPISEDVEICARIFNSRWNMYQSPFIHLHHRARRSVWSLVRQWWQYGFYAARVYKLHNPNIVEIFLFSPNTRIDFFDSVEHFHLLYYKEKAPLNVYVIINSFWLFHFGVVATVLCTLCSFFVFATIFAVATLMFFYRYAKSDFDQSSGSSVKRSIQLFMVRYMVNMSFSMGNFISGMMQRTFYLSHIVWDRSHGSVVKGRDDVSSGI